MQLLTKNTSVLQKQQNMKFRFIYIHRCLQSLIYLIDVYA